MAKSQVRKAAITTTVEAHRLAQELEVQLPRNYTLRRNTYVFRINYESPIKFHVIWWPIQPCYLGKRIFFNSQRYRGSYLPRRENSQRCASIPIEWTYPYNIALRSFSEFQRAYYFCFWRYYILFVASANQHRAAHLSRRICSFLKRRRRIGERERRKATFRNIRVLSGARPRPSCGRFRGFRAAISDIHHLLILSVDKPKISVDKPTIGARKTGSLVPSSASLRFGGDKEAV